MSKGLNTTAGLKAEWQRLKAEITGEAPKAAPPSEARPPSSVPVRTTNTTQGLKDAWASAKQKVLEQSDPKLAKRAEMRAKLDQLRALNPEAADQIEREIDRLDNEGK